MKDLKANKTILIIILILSPSFLVLCFGAGMGMGPPGPCPPFSPCWCAGHPNNPACAAVPVPIDGGLFILAGAGVYLGLRRRKSNYKI